MRSVSTIVIINNNMLYKITIIMCVYIKAEILLKNTLNLLKIICLK